MTARSMFLSFALLFTVALLPRPAHACAMYIPVAPEGTATVVPNAAPSVATAVVPSVAPSATPGVVIAPASGPTALERAMALIDEVALEAPKSLPGHEAAEPTGAVAEPPVPAAAP